jgi:two-component system chemotaxis response regulator CheY
MIKKKKRLRVLLVNDDEGMRKAQERWLEAYGFIIGATAADGGEALGIFEQNRAGFDLVLTDFNMPRMDGVRLAHGIRALGADTPIIIVTGEPERVRIAEKSCAVVENTKGMEVILRAIEELFSIP